MRIVTIIQARANSTRLPGKVFAKIGGQSVISRVCEAARGAQWADISTRTVVAWSHKYPWIKETDVLARFRDIAWKEKADIIIRLTSDCPLLNTQDIIDAWKCFWILKKPYFYNGIDGHDVQIFEKGVLFDPLMTDSEHVIRPYGKWSLDTEADLKNIVSYVEG